MNKELEWVSTLTGEIIKDSQLEEKCIEYAEYFTNLDEYDIYKAWKCHEYFTGDWETTPSLFDILFEDILDEDYVQAVNETINETNYEMLAEHDYIASVNALL